MSSQNQLQLCLDTAQSMVARLPPGVQKALANPYVKKGLAALIALRLVKGFSGYLSKRAQNSGLTIDRWDPKRELVVITGGCGGIGKKIMEDLNKRNVKVIILDVNEPSFSLRELNLFSGSIYTNDQSFKRLLLQDRYHISSSCERNSQSNQERPRHCHCPD